MRLLPLGAVSIVCAVATGCSSLDRAKPEGDYAYLQAKQGKDLNIPAGMVKPKESEEYNITPGQTQDNDNIDVRAPRLVLPLVSGSHVEEGSKQAKLWFDQIDDSRPLSEAVWDAVNTYLKKESLAVESFDSQSNILRSGWINLNKLSMATEAQLNADETGGWFDGLFSSEDGNVLETGRQQFEFSLETKPHGRTAALIVKLLNEEGNVAGIAPRNLESTMLNSVVAHYEHQLRIASEERRKLRREGLDSRLGFDNNGRPAYIIAADFERTWSRLPLVFLKLGFTVKDLDKSSGIFYVEYEEPESGWFSGLFSSEKGLAALGLKETKYRFRLGDLGSTTSIVIMDKDNEAIDNKVFTDIYQTFAEYMSSDSLDI